MLRPRLALLAGSALLAALAGCGAQPDAAATPPTAAAPTAAAPSSAAPTATAPVAAEADCPPEPAADPAARLPKGFPVLPGQVLYDPELQGKTRLVYGRLAATDFVATRDALAGQLRAQGYTIEGTDGESVEAEVEFSGPHEGTVKVALLCRGTLRLRYKLLS